MRFPNKQILSALYSCPDKHYAVVQSSRFSYRLYRDVMSPGFDVIQRTLLRDSSDVQQVGFSRPPQYK